MASITLNNINDIVENAVNRIDGNEKPWSSLDHGKLVLQDDYQCDCYLAAYGDAHIFKLRQAVAMLPVVEFGKNVEVFDWGCGQGLGTLCLCEYFQQIDLLGSIRAVNILEPSKIALERAKNYIRNLYPNLSIGTANKYLPMTNGDKINYFSSTTYCSPVAIHLFSNLLDIDNIDLQRIANIILGSNKIHYILCVGPANWREDRIDTFAKYFKEDSSKTDFFTRYKKYDFYTSKRYNIKTFGCYIQGFRYTAV